MKVLIVSGIFPPDIGGPASYVPTVGASLVEKGAEVSVLALSGSLEDDDWKYPFRVLRFVRSEFLPLRILRVGYAIYRLAGQVNLLFVNGLGLEAALVSCWKKVPVVIKVVGDPAWEWARRAGLRDNIDEFQHKRYDIGTEVRKLLRSWSTKRADAVIVPSRYVADLVRGWGVPEEKIHVIYNGVELLPSVWSDFLRRSERSDRGRTVVTVGRLVPWKEIDRLIKVVSDLDGNVKLIVVGDGPMRGELEREAQRLGVSDRVAFVGPLARDAVRNYLGMADLFVLNSTYEGLPHVVLEAMQVGVPVVATDVGGTREVIEHLENGWLVESGDDLQLKQAIISVLFDEHLSKRLSIGGIVTIAKSFTDTRMVEDTHRLLESVAGRRGKERSTKIRCKTTF